MLHPSQPIITNALRNEYMMFQDAFNRTEFDSLILLYIGDIIDGRRSDPGEDKWNIVKDFSKWLDETKH